MAKPYVHAVNSAKKWGGKPEDYEPIHAFLDSSKAVIADNRHRALTHTSWFVGHVLERVCFPNSCPMTADYRFPYIVNSDGRKVFVRDVGEQHCLEDFGMKYIPSAADYLVFMVFQDWMLNGQSGKPPSAELLLIGKANLD